MSTVLITGSARKDGETTFLVNRLIDRSGWDLVDLNDYDFSYFDYEHLNRDDDFIPLMRRLIEKYDTFVFLTPVYWYAMSGIMKVFFDRITDLITIEKDLGRKLRGKRMAAISSSIGNHLGDHFWLPFSETGKYLGMEYLVGLHCVVGENNEQVLSEFIASIEEGGA